jgi:hypothetical protein
MNKNHILALAAVAVIAVPMYGCTPAVKRNTGFVGNMNNTQMGTTGTTRNQNASTAYVPRADIANRLTTNVPGVRSAVVMVRGTNAYVAINRAAPGGVTGGGYIGGTTTGPTINGTVGGAGTPGTYRSPVNPYGPSSGAGGTSGYAGGTGGRITGGMTGGNMGTTGGMIGSTISDDTRRRIVQEIRTADPTIRNVYISDDPSLLARFQGFVNNAAGAARTGVNDIGNWIRQYFPGVRP